MHNVVLMKHMHLVGYVMNILQASRYSFYVYDWCMTIYWMFRGANCECQSINSLLSVPLCDASVCEQVEQWLLNTSVYCQVYAPRGAAHSVQCH